MMISTVDVQTAPVGAFVAVYHDGNCCLWERLDDDRFGCVIDDSGNYSWESDDIEHANSFLWQNPHIVWAPDSDMFAWISMVLGLTNSGRLIQQRILEELEHDVL